MKKILFVCHGNICRSPMAEFIMKKLVAEAGLEQDFEIASAATSTEELGNSVYPPARRKLAEHGISCDGKRARQMTRSDYEYYNLLVGMDQYNIRNMEHIVGGDTEGKIHLLLSFTGSNVSVADPWYTGDFEATWRDCMDGCTALLQTLCNETDKAESDTQRQDMVLNYLRSHDIPFECYTHPEGKTIEEAKRWWKDDGSIHCKNIFMRNHKGNKHYLICFHCDHDLDIHDLEGRLKERLQSQGLPSCGKLSFASPERMMKYLGLEPGSVSPFGLINDTENHVYLFLDEQLRHAEKLSFHPNDCRGTVVISKEDFEKYLACVGNTYEYLDL